ncbi:MAG TPA: ATP-binding protein [Verrucomicrobiae bacterium]|nr:ATP-binding protein [Verrucomicrobiae bacterium]
MIVEIIHLFIRTEFKVAMEVKDDGKGFAPENSPGPNDGHFGLLGMSERAKRLGGLITVTSAPGTGTVIRVEFPMLRPETRQPANEQQTDYAQNVADSNTHR